MSDKLEKLVEQFFAKQEKVFGIEEINSFIKEAVLQEANFTVDRLYRKDYQDKWIDAISKGLDFIVDIPGQEKKKIKIDKSFADVLAKAAAEGEQSIDLLFKGSGKQAASVIPDLEGNKYKLTNISKEPFTGKKSVGGVTLKGETNIKEGLVCYFYSLDSSILNQIEQKINTGANTKLNLDYGISTNPALMGEQATDKLKASIDFLSNQIVSKQEKDTYLNALSSARTVKNIAEGEIIDRGVLFNEIRKAGGMLTQQPPDKWSHGDVYLNKKKSIKAKKQIN
jgi:hypothetical protein